MGSQRHRCLCGCVTAMTPADGPWGVELVTACGRHGTWVEAEAEACAVGAATTRLDAAGYSDVDTVWAGDHWEFRISATAMQVEALRAVLNATEALQDWRVGWVAPEHREAFHILVVGHLLASVLASR